MGYDLVGEGGRYYRFNVRAWPYTFDLAVAFGWKPAGTKPQVLVNAETGEVIDEEADDAPFSLDVPTKLVMDLEDKSWDGSNYFSNDGQLVTSEDAAALAAALERALQAYRDADLPNGGHGTPSLVARLFGRRNSRQDNALRQMNEQFASDLKEFIDFCLQGEFAIC